MTQKIPAHKSQIRICKERNLYQEQYPLLKIQRKQIGRMKHNAKIDKHNRTTFPNLVLFSSRCQILIEPPSNDSDISNSVQMAAPVRGEYFQNSFQNSPLQLHP
ncbi:hypothetical protein G9A89_015259 [Geosiphon pyriformis]|nr:hypothetical protein G9A89_015259 [Geosiphon pyriformis]